jgi:hypothetical protein
MRVPTGRALTREASSERNDKTKSHSLHGLERPARSRHLGYLGLSNALQAIIASISAMRSGGDAADHFNGNERGGFERAHSLRNVWYRKRRLYCAASHLVIVLGRWPFVIRHRKRPIDAKRGRLYSRLDHRPTGRKRHWAESGDLRDDKTFEHFA